MSPNGVSEGESDAEEFAVLALDYRPPVVGQFRTTCSLTTLRRGLRSWEWAERNLIAAPDDPVLEMPRARIEGDTLGIVLKRGESIRLIDRSEDES